MNPYTRKLELAFTGYLKLGMAVSVAVGDTRAEVHADETKFAGKYLKVWAC